MKESQTACPFWAVRGQTPRWHEAKQVLAGKKQILPFNRDTKSNSESAAVSRQDRIVIKSRYFILKKLSVPLSQKPLASFFI